MMLLVFKGRKEENRKERRDSRERERQRGRLSPLYLMLFKMLPWYSTPSPMQLDMHS
jgi:hypothetical protein